jgi:2-dehydro-3-deoxygluconokinase
MKRVVTFGEVMIRLDVPDNGRFRQAIPGILRTTYAGAEANVAVSIAHLGGTSRFVTALPDNNLTDGCVAVLRSFQVETDCVVRLNTGRFGTYYVETGANQRPSNVLYDRDATSISSAQASDYDWDTAFANADWFHVSGITPALSMNAANTTIEAARVARSRGLTVSCDLNFRRKLWRWKPGTAPEVLAETTMGELLRHVDVLIANEEDVLNVFGLRPGESDVHSGIIAVDGYAAVARQIRSEFPTVSLIATTLRESISATHNNWGAMLFETSSGRVYTAPNHDNEYRPYAITSIVDRVGGGDSFAAGLIFALTTDELSDPKTALQFAAASSCLAHSIRGDFNLVTRSEVEALMAGSSSGRVVR